MSAGSGNARRRPSSMPPPGNALANMVVTLCYAAKCAASHMAHMW